MAGEPPLADELRALADRWDGRELELAERARIHSVRDEVSPLGYGHLDREPLLRERFWIPDPREVRVERPWTEQARLDGHGKLVAAEILDEAGHVQWRTYAVPESPGAFVTFAAWSRASKPLLHTRIECPAEGPMEIVATLIVSDGLIWFETYRYDGTGRVVRISESGGRYGPGPREGPGYARELTVAYTTRGVVESVLDQDGHTVYEQSDEDAVEIIRRVACRQADECVAWLKTLPFEVTCIAMGFLYAPDPSVHVEASSPQCDVDEWWPLDGMAATSLEEQQVALAGYASFSDSVAHEMAARFRERAPEFTHAPTLRFELEHEPFG